MYKTYRVQLRSRQVPLTEYIILVIDASVLDYFKFNISGAICSQINDNSKYYQPVFNLTEPYFSLEAS